MKWPRNLGKDAQTGPPSENADGKWKLSPYTC